MPTRGIESMNPEKCPECQGPLSSVGIKFRGDSASFRVVAPGRGDRDSEYCPSPSCPSHACPECGAKAIALVACLWGTPEPAYDRHEPGCELGPEDD